MLESNVCVLLLASIALVAGACGSSSDGEADASDSTTGGMGVPGTGGAEEILFEALPFEPPASGYVELNLYPGDPPNYLVTAPSESVDPTSGAIRDVSVPTLRRYPVDESKSSGVGFLALPGGAYNVLDMEVAATALAARLGPMGISVFGLKSRVGAGSTDARRDALLDVERALGLLRSHAAEWRLDPGRIGTASWSAGSHLALMLAGTFDEGEPTSGDPVERMSSRPDFMAVMCPWADGKSTSPFTFATATPPIYICHAQDDANSPIALAQALEQQLRVMGTPEHLEVYATGGHEAFNVGDPTATGRDWPDKYLLWLRSNQLIP